MLKKKSDPKISQSNEMGKNTDKSPNKFSLPLSINMKCLLKPKLLG